MRVLELVFVVVSFAIFVYFVLYSLATFALIAISLVETTLVKIDRGESFVPPRRLRRPALSIVAPAYDMESTIVPCARSFLACDYEPLSVLIVDDGSSDDTSGALVRAFDMIELPVGDGLAIDTEPITAMYVSRTDPRLQLVRKDNGGRSDAINAALNVAATELVAVIDADTLIERDALLRIAEVFALDPDNTVAVGGTVMIANGAVIRDNAVVRPRVARRGIEATQTAEYLRGFLGGRIAWSWLNGLIIISGAFGVFRRDLVRAAGGFSCDTLGEDMELTMRLHHQLRPARPQTRISYAADANVWTEAPATRRSLRTQRIRWHVGLLDNLNMHRRMFLRKRFAAIGLLSMPYTFLFETVGPLLQVAGYIILAVMVVLDQVSWWYVAAFFVVTLLVGQLQTAGAVLIEEVGFRRYQVRDLMWIAGWSLVEILWFRPLTAVWRVWATFLFLTGRRPGWGTLPRGGAFREEEQPELVSAPLPR